MKIAVYTIALNEEPFARRWADSAVDADYRIVADTGSTDGTVARLHDAGVDVHKIAIAPWRFDQARNASLACVPVDADICIALDMDEVLVPGWRAALEAAWASGTTRLRYHFVLNWDTKGRPKICYFASKIHQRHAYVWKHPAHELIYPLPGIAEQLAWTEQLHIHQHADASKSRGQYLDLMALAVREDPADDRCAHNHGFELMQHRQYEAAIAELNRHLALPSATRRAERAASLRYIGRCHVALGRPREARAAFERACTEAPEAREPWYDLGKFCMAQKDWVGGIDAARQMLAITEMPRDHVHIMKAWGVAPYDIGSLCAYYAGETELARDWLTKALELEPDNARLIKNGGWIFGQ